MALSARSQLAIDDIRSTAVGKKRIVFVSGVFNIVHPGHLRLLRFAAECGDFLVVGVLSDHLAKSAHLNEVMRQDGVAAIGWVGHAFILDDTPTNFISALKPPVVVMGKEHETAQNPELAATQAYGGQLLFGSGDSIFSSLDLLRRETERINYASIIQPKEFIANHGIQTFELHKTFAQMRGLKVCVIGDTIVDEYIQCDPLGMSQEDPTIVVTPIVASKFLGGAAIIAAHASGLGASAVSFVSVTGDDQARTFVEDKLMEYGVDAKLLTDVSRPTTLKQRYRAGNKTLLRVSHLRQHKVNNILQQQMLEYVKKVLVDVDLLIFSDFNYGVLPQSLVDEITQECIRQGVMFVADSQSSSQVGDVSRFMGTALLTPTEREARLALGNYEDGLVVLAEALRKKSNAANIVITLGAEGVLIHAANPDKAQWLTDRLPALNCDPKDPAGAGDCLLVASAMAMAVGCTIWTSLYIGSVAAACQVGRIGNTPLNAGELLEEVNKSNGFH
jgi:rfaE bifunctional protein kinase chain/domain